MEIYAGVRLARLTGLLMWVVEAALFGRRHGERRAPFRRYRGLRLGRSGGGTMALAARLPATGLAFPSATSDVPCSLFGNDAEGDRSPVTTSRI